MFRQQLGLRRSILCTVVTALTVVLLTPTTVTSSEKGGAISGSPIAARKPKHYCSLPPPWNANNKTDPMALYRSRGQVVVMALVKGDCQFCTLMVQAMHNIHWSYKLMNWNKLRFIVVNDKLYPSRARQLQRMTSATVYQLDRNSTMWEDIGAHNRDLLVYDSCGRLRYQLKYPFSDPGYYYAAAAIRNTYMFPAHSCGPCTPTDDMGQEQPALY